MKFEEVKFQTGDWILPFGQSWMGKIIDKITFGKVNHAAIVYDEFNVLETDGSWFKARFNHISDRYAKRPFILVRPLFLTNPSLLQALCKKYEGSPYSYWDIAKDALLAPLHPKIRIGLARIFGSKQFMICSEMVARITYEATGNKDLKDFEGLEPEDLRTIAYCDPTNYEITIVSL